MKEDLDITLYVAGMAFDPVAWRERALGGSETAGVAMAEALARLGHHVTVFCNLEARAEHAGVIFLPLKLFSSYVQRVPFDVLVLQRLPALLAQRTTARLNLLWLHDLPTARSAEDIRSCLWNIDRCLVVSELQKRRYEAMSGPLGDLYHVTRNGIDPGLFGTPGAHPERREVIYGARPERGLDVLVEKIMPRIWASRPDVVLKVCTYDDDFASSPLKEFYGHVERLIAQANAGRERVKLLGALSKRDLYAEYGRAALYLYPTPSPLMPDFREVSCISAMECMGAGLPVVTSRLGALPETLALGSAELIDGMPETDEYQSRFAATVLRLLDDADAREVMAASGRAQAATLGWDSVAREWQQRFWQWIDERNDRPSRLVRHFIWHSDIIAARQVLDRMPEGADRRQYRELLDEGPWSFVAKGEWEQPYAAVSEDPASFESVAGCERFTFLVDELKKRPQARRILDAGCAHGAFQVMANNALAQPRDWVGLDVSKGAITLARSLARERARFPERHRFFAWGARGEVFSDPEKFDLVVAFEVLEHVPSPWEFMNELEQHLSPEGEVLITVPSGPWEAITYETDPRRFHVWHFDLHDLRDMFLHKPGFVAWYSGQSSSPRDAAPLGWWFIKYRAGTAPVRPIDMERHLRLQRPRETVSAVLMAGPGAEETLHWCLPSVTAVADETLLVDNGLTEEARRIVAQYPVELVPGASPLEHGFEHPRNLGLGRAQEDWVLWLDADERLMNPERLPYYLRRSTLDGYALTQHNFCCDGPGRNEQPPRLIRNNGRRNDGRAIQFIGMIHEGPEVALNAGPGLVAAIPDVPIAHIGYLTHAMRLKKFERNAALLARDREKYPDRLLGYALQMRDNMTLCRLLLDRNGGVVDADVIGLCRNAAAIYREFFLGKRFPDGSVPQFAILGLEDYSKALELLGEGFEFSWSALALHGSMKTVTRKARFASVDEVQATLQIVLSGSRHRMEMDD